MNFPVLPILSLVLPFQDVCVPLSHLAECITKSKEELDASSLLWYVARIILCYVNYLNSSFPMNFFYTKCLLMKLDVFSPPKSLVMQWRYWICSDFCFHPLSTVISHAGDGNFHTIILFDPKKEEDRQEAERLNHLMVKIALSMEGNFFCHAMIIKMLKYINAW